MPNQINPPKNSNAFWKIINKADNTPAEMLLYGEISSRSWYGDEVTPKQFAEDLKSLGGKNLILRVNSPGGDVFAAQAMYNLLKSYSGTITAHIDGMAASAATIVTCAADKVVMPDNGIYMIHNPACVVPDLVDVPKLERLTKSLTAVKQTIVNIYNRKCKKLSDGELEQMMDAETWMTADEALDRGFVDEIDTDEQIENSLNGTIAIVNNISIDTSRYAQPDKLKDILRKEKAKMENEATLLDKIKALINGNAENENDDPVATERQRMLDLDAMRDGSEIVDKIIDIAKRKGNTAAEIKEYVDQVKSDKTANKQQQSGIDEIKNLIKDQMGSGAGAIAVNATEHYAAGNEQQNMMQEVSSLVNAMKNLRGEK